MKYIDKEVYDLMENEDGIIFAQFKTIGEINGGEYVVRVHTVPLKDFVEFISPYMTDIN